MRRPRLVLAALVLVAGLSLSACKEVEEESAAGYEPAKLGKAEGKSDDFKLVTFTEEGSARVGLKTGAIRRSGAHKVVPYTALLYNDEAKTFVYTSPKTLSYVRESVEVDRIEGDRVLLSDGPPAGTTVVTVGATEVYGAELEIAEK
jgi:hypothetical protein